MSFNKNARFVRPYLEMPKDIKDLIESFSEEYTAAEVNTNLMACGVYLSDGLIRYARQAYFFKMCRCTEMDSGSCEMCERGYDEDV